MEQHPVPQNITSFEFRLIGSMTLRQFGFLAIGTILAFIVWELPIPDFIRIPLAAILAFFGLAFAFLPYEDRPLHRWALSFFKAAYSPTQYLFQKTGVIPLYLRSDFLMATQKIMPVLRVRESQQKLEEYLKTLPKSLPTALDTKENASLTKIQAMIGTLAAMSAPRPTPTTQLFTSPFQLEPKGTLKEGAPPQPPKKKLAFAGEGRLLFEEEGKTPTAIPFTPTALASRSELLVDHIKRLKKAIEEMQTHQPSLQGPRGETVDFQERLVTLERQLEETEDEKEALMRMMIKLQIQMAQKPKGVTPTEVLGASPAGKIISAAKIISAQAAKEVGLPRLTTTPNVITGVVQDKRGIFLPNILVEIKDAGGNSVRAFKTNKLGQFAAVTPLENGSYKLEFEDPRGQFNFDIIEVGVNGSILPPLAIYAKDKTELEKEKIRQSLFGNN